MSNIILTKAQKKGTLSSLKKPAPTKNVIFKSVTDYWPSLDEVQSAKFRELMKEFVETDNGSISIGLESVLRLSKKGVMLVGIADELSPRWFAKQLIAMILTRHPNTMVVIIPQLKDVIKKLTKTGGIIFCIKETENLKTVEIANWYHQMNLHAQLLKNYYTIKPEKRVSVKKKKREQTPVSPQIVRLPKSTDGRKAFIPFSDESQLQQQKEEKDESYGFISLKKFSDNFVLESSVPLYRPIKIKKTMGNLNRRNNKSAI